MNYQCMTRKSQATYISHLNVIASYSHVPMMEPQIVILWSENFQNSPIFQKYWQLKFQPMRDRLSPIRIQCGF